MDDAYSRSAVHCDADHACYVVKVSFLERLCAVDRVNPHGNIFCLKFFSVGAWIQIHRGHRGLVLHDLLQLLLVLLRLLAAPLRRLLEKVSGQEWTFAGLQQLLWLDESIVCIVGLFCWLFTLADYLYTWKKLT